MISKRVTKQARDYTEENVNLFLQLLVAAVLSIGAIALLALIAAMLGSDGGGMLPWKPR